MKETCVHCNEARLNIGEKSDYGATIIYKKGGEQEGWFATLSPKTGGDQEKDFTIQLMPIAHLNHISEIDNNIKLAENYGIAFSKIAHAITKVMKEENREKENDENVIRIGTYGKSKHPKEHFHIKLFPWTNKIGQPYTVDSSFENMEVQRDKEGKEFIKMDPIKKERIPDKRHNLLTKRFISLLN